MFRKYVLPYLIWFIYQPLRLSWRFQIVEHPELVRLRAQNQTVVFAHWHGDELGTIYMLKYVRACAMTSTSKDGELMNSVLHLMGVKTSRGSSTRGGVAALKGILRLAKEGFNPSVAIDGPKGPRHKVKPGVLEISKLLNAPIIPFGVACSHSFVFKRSWNKAYLPLPFAKIVVVFGAPVPAVLRDQDSHEPNLAESLERAMGVAQQTARNLIATPSNPS